MRADHDTAMREVNSARPCFGGKYRKNDESNKRDIFLKHFLEIFETIIPMATQKSHWQRVCITRRPTICQWRSSYGPCYQQGIQNVTFGPIFNTNVAQLSVK